MDPESSEDRSTIEDRFAEQEILRYSTWSSVVVIVGVMVVLAVRRPYPTPFPKKRTGSLVHADARRGVADCCEDCQAAKRAAADIEGHSATTKFSQPRRLSNIVCGVWNGQRGLFLPSELDPELGLVKPNDFACSSGLIFQHNFELRRNAGRGLNLQARAPRWHIC